MKTDKELLIERTQQRDIAEQAAMRLAFRVRELEAEVAIHRAARFPLAHKDVIEPPDHAEFLRRSRASLEALRRGEE